MSRLEAFVCGGYGETLGETVEISMTGHERTFSSLEESRFPLLGRMTVYNRGTSFSVDFLKELELEVCSLLEDKKNDSHATGLLTSFLCLIQRGSREARPVKIEFSET